MRSAISSGKKTDQGHIVSWELDTSKAKAIAERIKNQEKINDLTQTITDQQTLKELLSYALFLVVEDFLEDNILSKEEESIIDQFVESSEFSGTDLDQYQAMRKIARSIILREVMEGKLPKEYVNFQMPIRFNFMKSETLVWAFEDVGYYKE
ncbi:MAG: hypothetical protein R6U13_07605, partial [Desulfatiglandaceae bacterium]